MPSDQNPWNLGGGPRRPSNPIQGPWGGGGGSGGGQLPPELDRLMAQLRAMLRRFLGGAGGSDGRGAVLAPGDHVGLTSVLLGSVDSFSAFVDRVSESPSCRRQQR